MDIPRIDPDTIVSTPYGNSDFEKVAQEMELSQDVRDWPAAILQEFASEHPYAFQTTAPEIEFEKIDEKSGTAFGAIILKKPYQVTGLGGPQERLEQEPEKVAVPIIIEAFRLKPFEVFIRGEKVMPLTEARYMEAHAGAQMANGMDPYFQPSPMFVDKMLPPTVGYLGNMYGTYASHGSDAGFGSHKGASDGEPKLEKKGGSSDPGQDLTFVSQLKGTISKADYDDFRGQVGDHRVLSGFALNKTMNVVREILGTAPTKFDDYLDFVEGAAPIHLVRLCRRSNGRWSAAETNDYFFKPVVKEMSAKEILERYGKIEPSLGRLMATSNEILLEADGRVHVKPILLEEHELVAEPVKADGHYLFVTKNGGFVEGQAFTRVLDYSGNPTGHMLVVTGNAHTVQECLVGERQGDVLPALTPGSVEVGAHGTFAGLQDGVQSVILPFRVTNVGLVNNYMVVQAIGVAGEQLAFVFMPGVTRFFNATGIASPALGGLVGGNIFYVPPSFHFLTVGKKLSLIGDPREAKSVLSRRVFFDAGRHVEPFTVETTKRGHDRALRVIATQDGLFVLKGAILETLQRDIELQDLSGHEVHWILSLLGVELKEAARVTALAIDKGEVNVTNLRPAKDMVVRDKAQSAALADLASVFRRNLTKAASTLGDPKAADALLSLNFVNENNLVQFLNNVPAFREVEEKLAELYLYAALGLKNQVPDQAVVMAMKALNEVNEHLEYLSSMIRMPQSQSQPAPTA